MTQIEREAQQAKTDIFSRAKNIIRTNPFSTIALGMAAVAPFFGPLQSYGAAGIVFSTIAYQLIKRFDHDERPVFSCIGGAAFAGILSTIFTPDNSHLENAWKDSVQQQAVDQAGKGKDLVVLSRSEAFRDTSFSAGLTWNKKFFTKTYKYQLKVDSRFGPIIAGHESSSDNSVSRPVYLEPNNLAAFTRSYNPAPG